MQWGPVVKTGEESGVSREEGRGSTGPGKRRAQAALRFQGESRCRPREEWGDSGWRWQVGYSQGGPETLRELRQCSRWEPGQRPQAARWGSGQDGPTQIHFEGRELAGPAEELRTGWGEAGAEEGWLWGLPTMLCHRLGTGRSGGRRLAAGRREAGWEPGFRRLIESEKLRGTQGEMPRRQPCVRVKSSWQDRLETKSGALSV